MKKQQRLPSAVRPPPVLSVRIIADSGSAPNIESVLSLLGIQAVQTERLDTGGTIFDSYHSDMQSALRCRNALLKCLTGTASRRRPTLNVVRLKQQDWSENWKRFHHPNRVSRRLVIKPSWRSYRPRPGEHVIRLDPGMSFGTGLHPTTKACLRFLDRITLERDFSSCSFLDVGCGSGILSIAAAMLGFGKVVGIDNDPVAVRTASENAAINNVGKKTAFLCKDAGSFRKRENFDVVAANMLAHELEPAVRMISGATSRTGEARILIAGTLASQLPHISAMFRKHGFKVIERVTEGDWMSACLVRKQERKRD